MQNPLGAAFARKVLRRKARDEGRTRVLFDEGRNATAGHFSCKPFGAVLGGARRSGRAKATAQRRRATRSRSPVLLRSVYGPRDRLLCCEPCE
jgi:hypothetical protein